MSVRQDRVGEAMREIIALELLHLTDPRLEHVSITGVDVSPDLSQATVYFDVLDSTKSVPAKAGLTSARGRLQRRVNEGLHIRRTPKLQFAVDPGIVYGEGVDAALRTLMSSQAKGCGPSEDERQ